MLRLTRQGQEVLPPRLPRHYTTGARIVQICAFCMFVKNVNGKISQSCSGSIEVTRVNIWVPGFLPACLVSLKTMKICVSFSSQGPRCSPTRPGVHPAGLLYHKTMKIWVSFSYQGPQSMTCYLPKCPKVPNMCPL